MEVLFEDVVSRSPPITFLPPLVHVDPGSVLAFVRLVGFSKSSGSISWAVGHACCFVLDQYRSVKP